MPLQRRPWKPPRPATWSLSILHTLDTVRTVNRVLDLLPPHEREVARILFAEVAGGDCLPAPTA
jgi:hypothetical protein